MCNVGFVGLGIMGAPMAANLLKAGVPLMVNDVNEKAVEKALSLGATRGTLREIGKTCDVVFLCLPLESISKEVLFGEDGIASELSPGKTVCDFSSVTPTCSNYCYDELSKIGVGFVDAPVSGGEEGAIAGTLAVMCGGDEASFNKLKPYFDIVGSSAILVGKSGSGSVTKLANQIIVNNTIAAVSEALVLAAKAGTDPEKVFYAIRGGLAGSSVLETKAPKMISRDFTPGGRISINHKDIKNVMATAHDLDIPLPMTAQLYEIMQTLKVHGHMGDDHSGIVQYFEKLADVTVGKKGE